MIADPLWSCVMLLCGPLWSFAVFSHTPRNQPALAQTYATVVFGEGRVSGEQMLTVGRGLRTTATAAVHKALFQLTHCQESVRVQAVAAANNMSVVNIAHVIIVTLRYTKPGPSAKREIQGPV